MYKSKKAVGILVLVMVFMMMFSSVAMAAEADSVKLTTISNIDTVNITQEEADRLFYIENNIIVGLTAAGMNSSKLILPDTIDGQKVKVDYDSLASYGKVVNASLHRSQSDQDAIEIMEEQAATLKASFHSLLIIMALILISKMLEYINDYYTDHAYPHLFYPQCSATYLAMDESLPCRLNRKKALIISHLTGIAMIICSVSAIILLIRLLILW